MATRIKQIISVMALAGGATQVFPHALNWSGRPVIPDYAEPNDDDINGDLEIVSATTTTVTIKNNGLGPVTAFVLLESWHTLEREFGASGVVALTPQPFVPARGASAATGITIEDEGVAIPGNPHDTLNFVGGGVVAADAGSGVATIMVPGITIEDEGVAIPGSPHDTLNFVGAGVTATNAGGGVATITIQDQSAIIAFGDNSIAAGADTRFLDQWGNTGTGTAGTTDIAPIVAPRAGRLRNLFVRHQAAVGNGNTIVYTVMINGVASILTVTLASGAIATGSDLVNSVVVAQGDRISLQAVKAVAIGNGAVVPSVTMEL